MRHRLAREAEPNLSETGRIVVGNESANRPPGAARDDLTARQQAVLDFATGLGMGFDRRLGPPAGAFQGHFG